MDLSNLKAAEGSVHSGNFRRGRGHGSGNGKTAGKGHKGQKRGFTNRNTKLVAYVNVEKLNKFEDGAVVDIQTLVEAGAVKNRFDAVKILGNGDLTKKLTVKANAFSEGAKAKIEAAGGNVEVI